MHAPRVYPRGLQLHAVILAPQEVDRVTSLDDSLDDQSTRTQVDDGASRFLRGLYVPHLSPGEDLRFVKVGRDQVGQWKELGLESMLGLLRQKQRAVPRDHDRIHDEREGKCGGPSGDG